MLSYRCCFWLLSAACITGTGSPSGIASILAEVEESMLYDYVGQLSGEFRCWIGAQPTSLRRDTRNRATDCQGNAVRIRTHESLGCRPATRSGSGCMFNNDISAGMVSGKKPDHSSRRNSLGDGPPGSHAFGDRISCADKCQRRGRGAGGVDLLSRHNFSGRSGSC